jgi:hypothetical protein
MAVFSAGHILTAADFDTLFPTGVGALTAYTPVLTQTNTPTISVEYATYMKIGRKSDIFLSIAPTSAGTAGGTVLVTFPAAIGTIVNFRSVGTAAIFDASASIWYTGMALWNSATTFKIQANADAAASPLGAVGSDFPLALAAGDLIVASLQVYTTT